MSFDFIQLIGIVGFVLCITKGKIFNPLRDFLGSFKHKWNPLSLFAELIGCPMCLGFWVGILWSWFNGVTFDHMIVFSGIVSLFSFFVGVIFSLLDFASVKFSSSMNRFESILNSFAPRVQTKEVKKIHPLDKDITEEEANFLLEKDNELYD